MLCRLLCIELIVSFPCCTQHIFLSYSSEEKLLPPLSFTLVSNSANGVYRNVMWQKIVCEEIIKWWDVEATILIQNWNIWFFRVKGINHRLKGTHPLHYSMRLVEVFRSYWSNCKQSVFFSIVSLSFYSPTLYSTIARLELLILFITDPEFNW